MGPQKPRSALPAATPTPPPREGPLWLPARLRITVQNQARPAPPTTAGRDRRNPRPRPSAPARLSTDDPPWRSLERGQPNRTNARLSAAGQEAAAGAPRLPCAKARRRPAPPVDEAAPRSPPLERGREIPPPPTPREIFPATLAGGDVHYCSTPAITTAGHNPVSLSITPRTRLRTVRVIQPAKALLSPFSYIVTTKSQDSLYEKVIVHTYDEKKSRIKGSRILHIEPMWVNTWELVDCVKPDGELSNTICDIAISVLQESCPEKKVIFPYIVTKYLMEHKFNSKIVQNYFRKDEKYKLSHKDLLSFPILQTLGVPRKGKKPIGHWYVLSLNMGAKRFEILDSLRGEDDMDMIEHANKLVEAIKTMYKINYSDSYRQIDDFELITDCGFFMLKFLELWNGNVVPAISQDQIPALRKVKTSLWLEHDRNEIINWRSLLDNNMI
ncbi:hypothetical protein ACQ4PT_018337 [Festuca glaucescens]